ncbi:hypothetical protein [Geobacter sulfurreducens]|uniref:hypothetical protein n=1 Tax=Geobacter sulfurreducens TaxID=35554 RepID=UPI002CB1F4A0|nr:hypothetical protein [Geobacter sulfurreducens]HML80043.1 hypothetical protein [Geobacter sulfurreducens]
MVIAGSDVTMGSSRVSIERYERKESLKMWVGDKRPDFEGEERGIGLGPDRVDLSERSRAAEAHARNAEKKQAAEDTEEAGCGCAEDNLEPRLRLLKDLIEQLTGRSIRVFDMEEAKKAADTADGEGAAAGGEDGGAGFGIEYDFYESRYEFESTAFAASGVIRTADGQEIRFDLGMLMEREHFSETSVSLRAGDAVKKDPLVINFNGTAAELTDLRFSFDLDADGTADRIASLGSGSGYLALDRNGDGVVNNGSELFGPATGEGFAELAAYDDDGNGWIDERDAVFSHLTVWTGASATSAGTLTGLARAGIGAIYLGNQSTPFDLKDGDNQLLGSVRSTGIFVGEKGSVGTVQQIDLAV